MLSKVFNKIKPTSSLVTSMQRGVYTKETQPYVFINQHTKVLVQGMTGKHVSNYPQLTNQYREPSIPSSRRSMELTLLEESTRERLAVSISESLFMLTFLKV